MVTQTADFLVSLIIHVILHFMKVCALYIQPSIKNNKIAFK